MTAEWEQDSRAGTRRLALPLAFVLLGLVAGVLARPQSADHTFSVLPDVAPPRVPSIAPRPAATSGGSWAAAAPGPLSSRDDPVVTTGDEVLLVWGGRTLTSPDHLRDGALYDPRSDQWSTTPPAPIPGRIAAAAVWTGAAFVIWGGAANDRVLGDGAAYDPATGRWQRLPPSPLSARREAAAVAVGDTVVIWGGRERVGGPHLSDGATFDLGTRRWRRMPPGPLADRDAQELAAARIGSSALVWWASGRTARVVAFDVRSRRWRRLVTPRLQTDHRPAMLAMDGAVLAWGRWSMGDEGPLALTFTTSPDWWSTIARPPFSPEPQRPLLGDDGIAASWSPLGGGVYYDVLANEWRAMAGGPDPKGVGWPSQAWVGDRLVVWYGLSQPEFAQRTSVWQPPKPWSLLEGAPVPIADDSGALWTGWLQEQQQVLVWGGRGRAPSNVGAAYDPGLGLWETMPRAPLAPRFGHATVWTGEELIVLGGYAATGEGDNGAAAYDPTRRRWRRLPRVPVPVVEGAAAWSGEAVYAAGTEDGAAVVMELPGPRGAWRALPPPPLQRPTHLTTVWSGLELWVVDVSEDGRITGAAWSPRHRDWRPLPPRSGMRGAAFAWGGRRLFAVGRDGTTVSLGLSLELWRDHPPSRLRGEPRTLAWTGRRLVNYLPGQGRLAFLDPRAGAWSEGIEPFGPTASAEMVWTGRQLFAFGGGQVAVFGGAAD